MSHFLLTFFDSCFWQEILKSETGFNITRSYSPLRPTSSSYGGPRPTAKAFFALGKGLEGGNQKSEFQYAQKQIKSLGQYNFLYDS